MRASRSRSTAWRTRCRRTRRGSRTATAPSRAPASSSLSALRTSGSPCCPRSSSRASPRRPHPHPHPHPNPNPNPNPHPSPNPSPHFIPGFPQAATSWLWECMHVAFVPEMICPSQQHKRALQAHTCSPPHAPHVLSAPRALLPARLTAGGGSRRAGPRLEAAWVPPGCTRALGAAGQGLGRVGGAAQPRRRSEAPPTPQASDLGC